MAPSELSENSRILIIGCGVWGLSTALHLARRGFKKVDILDVHPVPSPISAANDVNKIVNHRAASSTETDPRLIASSMLTGEALKGWREDIIFSPYFCESGIIFAGHTPELNDYIYEKIVRPSQSKYPFVKLDTPEDIRNCMPRGVLTGDLPGWQGWYKKKDAGYLQSQKVMISAFSEATRLGVNVIEGHPQGSVESLVYENGDVVGVKTVDGRIHHADRTIVCAGANADLLLDFKKQLRPTAWALCHIQMQPGELKPYRKLPVLINVAKGHFVEPDPDQRQLKISADNPGYINWVKNPSCPGDKRSIPFPRHQIPAEAETLVRDFLHDTMPHLADRPLAFARLCWDVDTPDMVPLIDVHPDHPSLVVATGGSKFGAMLMPNIGGHIVDAMLGEMRPEIKAAVRWRPEIAQDRDWKSAHGRFGARKEVMDLQDVLDDGWTSVAEETSPVAFQALPTEKVPPVS